MAGQRGDLSAVERFWTWPVAERSDAFAALRRLPGPAYFTEPVVGSGLGGVGDLGWWALTRLADVRAATSRPDLFRSGPGRTDLVDLPVAADQDRLRRIAARALAPARVRGLAAFARRLSEQFARDIVAEVRERGRCDAANDIAARLPLAVTCALLGIPAAHQDLAARQGAIALAAGARPTRLREIARPAAELTELLTDLGHARRDRPGPDLLSALVGAEDAEDPLDPAELVGVFLALLMTGQTAVRNAISAGIAALGQFPEQALRWRTDLDAVTPTAVEEIIRWASPVVAAPRTVAQPALVGGQRLDQGDQVLLFYWSANRDEQFFAEPDRFDVRRSPNPHLGFGRSGPLPCLGSRLGSCLARLELTVLFRELLTALPGLRPSAEPTWRTSTFVSGIEHLPCEVAPM
jgi:cytochrome P450